MNELHVSATDFRVHLKDYLNQVAEGGASVVVVRHGFNMGVMIDLQEYRAFQRWKQRQSGEPIAPDEYPDNMPLDEIERVYRQTATSTDDWTMRWRGRAFAIYRSRTGKCLEGDPPS